MLDFAISCKQSHVIYGSQQHGRVCSTITHHGPGTTQRLFGIEKCSVSQRLVENIASGVETTLREECRSGCMALSLYTSPERTLPMTARLMHHASAATSQPSKTPCCNSTPMLPKPSVPRHLHRPGDHSTHLPAILRMLSSMSSSMPFPHPTHCRSLLQ